MKVTVSTFTGHHPWALEVANQGKTVPLTAKVEPSWDGLPWPGIRGIDSDKSSNKSSLTRLHNYCRVTLSHVGYLD